MQHTKIIHNFATEEKHELIFARKKNALFEKNTITLKYKTL